MIVTSHSGPIVFKIATTPRRQRSSPEVGQGGMSPHAGENIVTGQTSDVGPDAGEKFEEWTGLHQMMLSYIDAHLGFHDQNSRAV
jgi:hypothetical protein